MTVPYVFANLSGDIALAKLDSNFNTPITIGNTSVLLGNTVSTLTNLTLGNVTITSGNIFTIPATSGGTGLVSPGSTGNVLTSNGTAWVSTALTSVPSVTGISFGSTGLTPSTNTTGNVTVAGTLVAGSGGTGLSSLTANSVLLGNGSSTIQFVSPGASGNVLTSNGTIWSSSAPTGGGGMTLVATLTIVAGTGQYFVTDLPSYKSFIITTPPIAFSSTTSVSFALSSDNGSTYGSGFTFTNSGTSSVSGYVQMFKTDDSLSFKPLVYVNTTTQATSSYTAVTGIVNAIKISTSTTTFTSGGPVSIYGMN